MNTIKLISALIMLAVAVLCFVGGQYVPAFMSIAAAALLFIPVDKREKK